MEDIIDFKGQKKAFSNRKIPKSTLNENIEQ